MLEKEGGGEMKDESFREDDEIRSSNPSEIRALSPKPTMRQLTSDPPSVDDTHSHTSAPLCRSFNEKSILQSHLAGSRGCLKQRDAKIERYESKKKKKRNKDEREETNEKKEGKEKEREGR